MPTGSGKTRTSMEIICEFINDTKKDVLWLANTEELCDQAYDSFNEVWHFIRKCEARSINHIRITEPCECVGFPTFHVSSIQAFNTNDWMSKLDEMCIRTDNLALVIVDEAHISIAPTYKNTIGKLIDGGAKLLGLTATPGRELRSISTTDSIDENQQLAEFYFNKVFQIDSENQTQIEFLRNKGILSNSFFRSIEGASIESLYSQSELNKIAFDKKIPERIESILTNNADRTAIIFDQLLSLTKTEKKILFFGTSIIHSKIICTLLKMKGIRAAHVDGNSGSYRRSIIKAFKEGEIQVLCNYGVLSTGFDDPKIDIVFMARPTNSIVLYSQIIGRGLRGPLIGGTDTCEIYTVFDNINGLPSNEEIAEYFTEYYINEPR